MVGNNQFSTNMRKYIFKLHDELIYHNVNTTKDIISWSPDPSLLQCDLFKYIYNLNVSLNLTSLNLLATNFLIYLSIVSSPVTSSFFFFNDPAPPEFSPLPLPAPLPIFFDRRYEDFADASAAAWARPLAFIAQHACPRRPRRLNTTHGRARRRHPPRHAAAADPARA